MSELIFYKNIVPLNKEVHKDFRFAPIEDFGFAAKTNSVVLATAEFSEASKEYPIVFVKTADGKVVPMAILGVKADENLYVDDNGKWNAAYVPAYVRRYPFVMADDGAGTLTVCVDDSCSGLNTKEGEPIFGADGEASDWMRGIVDFMQMYIAEFSRTGAFVDKLEKLGLLTEMSAKLETKGGAEFVLNGFMVIDEAKFMALDEDKIQDLFKSGEMGWIFAHLMSLSNLNRLMERVVRKNRVSLQ